MTPILIDIETLPHDASAGMDVERHVFTLPPPEAPSRYSKPESIKAWQDDPVNRIEAWERGVFDWRTVRIGCIGVAWGFGTGVDVPVVGAVGDTMAHAISEAGESVVSLVIDCEEIGEAAGLRRLLDAIPSSGPIYTWGDYDARVIRSRLMHHRIPFGPFTTSGKPWDRRVVDVQRAFAEIVNGHPSSIKGISVDNACAFLGIERDANPISGADVLPCYIGGEWEKAIAHCHADVRDEWAVVSVLRGLGVEL